MDQIKKDKREPRPVTRKVLAGFLLAFVAILLAFTITRYAFQDMLGTVEELSAPSEKLTLLNQVFHEITTLDQLQRAEAIRNPKKPQSSFLNQSQRTISLIDSMILMDWDTLQKQRIASMKEILRNRDSLFFSYLKQKSTLIDNKSLTRRIDTLSTIIEKKKIEVDSGVVTTEKRTTTTYVKDTLTATSKDDRNFFGKLFGKKKKTPDVPAQLKVQEELTVMVDTVAIIRQNKALKEVEKIVHDLEADQRTQNKQLLARELELINANSHLVTQLLSILRQVEKEEVERMNEQSHEARNVVKESIQRISLLLLVFFLGAALLVYLIWLDISRSNYYKLQLEKARDEAEQLSLIKQRFLANMSHEIRTPLQSIIGFAEHLKQQQAPDREAVDAIYSSSEHLLHIVNEVLDYSRISSGNFTIASEDFDLMSVIREVESAMRIQAEKKDLSLILDLEQATRHILSGDSFRLRQILYNVLGNAVKFTTRGFVKLSVRTKEERDYVRCEFIVSDSGMGIKQEDINRIFNQFEQADTSITRNYGGTGLGLTIVKSLIEAQGGELKVESIPAKGSTFTISIPFDKSEKVEEANEKVSPIRRNSFTGKVLVVDDDLMILRLCGLILTKNHIAHTLFDDAEKLLHEIPDPEATHILMDIRMPKINGVDLCRELRKKYPKEVSFVALTAHVFEQDKKVLYTQGFDVVLSKPFHEEEIMELLGVNAIEEPDFGTTSEKETGDYEIDLLPLRKLTMNDESLFYSVLQQFIEETSMELETLQDAITSADRSIIRELCHKMAGRVGQIGAPDLSLKLREVEKRIENGDDIQGIIPMVIMLRDEMKTVIRVLSKIALSKSNH